MYLSISVIVHNIDKHTFHFSYYIILAFVCEAVVIGIYWILIGEKDQLKFRQEIYLSNDYSFKELIVQLANFYSFYVLIGTILLFVIAYLVFFGHGRMQYYVVGNRLQNEYDFYDFSLLSIFFALVMAPVFEEFIFRHILVNQFKKISDQKTFVITGVTILFIIVHMPGDLITYNNLALPSFFTIILIEIGLASIFFTMVYLKTERLSYAIIAHSAWNFVDLVFLSIILSTNNPIMVSFFEFFLMVIVAIVLVLVKKNYWSQYLQSIRENIQENLAIFAIVFFIIIFILLDIVYYIFTILYNM